MSSRIPTYITAMAFLIVFSMTRLAAQEYRGQPSYRVVDLGTLGGNFSFAFGINDRGGVDGYSTLPGDTSLHAFVWHHGVMTDLGTLGGPNSQASFGPNERGQAAGLAENSTSDPNGEDFCGLGTHLICLPFLWQDGVMSPLPTLGGNNGQASDINNRGQVVGFAENTTPDPDCPAPQVRQFKPVTWAKGQIRELPTFPGDTEGVAFGSNDHGQVVGTSGTCAGYNTDFGIYLQPLHALVWENGKVTDLGNLGGANNNLAFGIDNQGQSVGVSDLSGDTTHHAFLWRNGAMTDLGTLPGDVESGALGISEGRVIGISISADTGSPSRAFLWEEGVMFDLNTLISAASPLFLLEATAINSRGEIVGFGLQTSTGDVHAFLAIPNHGSWEVAPEAAGRFGRTPQVVLPERVRKLLRGRLHFGLLGARVAVRDESN